MYIMNESEKEGRRLVIIAICIFVGYDILDLTTYGLANQGFLSGIVSVIFIAFISYYFYKGSKLFRIAAAILLILSGVLYLGRIVEGVIASAPMSFFYIFLAASFLLNFISGIILLASKNVKNFMLFQSRK